MCQAFYHNLLIKFIHVDILTSWITFKQGSRYQSSFRFWETVIYMNLFPPLWQHLFFSFYLTRKVLVDWKRSWWLNSPIVGKLTTQGSHSYNIIQLKKFLRFGNFFKKIPCYASFKIVSIDIYAEFFLFVRC